LILCQISHNFIGPFLEERK